MNQMLYCTINMSTSKQNIELTIDYGDTDTQTIPVTGSATWTYGIEFNNSLTSATDSSSSTYMLINTEMLEHGYINSIVVYCTQPGTITLSLIRFDTLCGLTSTCFSYFSSMTSDSFYTNQSVVWNSVSLKLNSTGYHQTN
jgi:hypothetical protein